MPSQDEFRQAGDDGQGRTPGRMRDERMARLWRAYSRGTHQPVVGELLDAIEAERHHSRAVEKQCNEALR